MSDFRTRVVEEKGQLDEKLSKLNAFISGDIYWGLPDEERDRLCRQRDLMTDYSKVLGERIKAMVIPK